MNMKRSNLKTGMIRFLCLLFMVGILFILQNKTVYATEDTTGTTNPSTVINQPGTAETPEEVAELNVANNLTITYDDGNGEIAGSLRILITLTAISLAPIMLVMLTSFTRIIVVLHFTRAALNTNTAPPNNVMIALALFLTFFIMSPTITTIYDTAIVPFDKGEITQEEALEIGLEPLRDFMYKETQTKDVSMFMEIAGNEWTGTGRDSHIGIDSKFYYWRVKSSIYYRFFNLYSLYRNRYGCGVYTDGYGYDDATAYNHIHAI